MADESTHVAMSTNSNSSEKPNEEKPAPPNTNEALQNANLSGATMDGEAHTSEEAKTEAPSENPASNVNGGTAVTHAGLASPPAEPTMPQSDNTESKPPVTTNDPNPVTPGGRGKKNSNGSAKKRSSGVPEHRSRKQGKKKAKPTVHLDAKPGELFLARMKGHQPWPSIICDEDMLPSVLLNNRPTTAAQADGSFKKADYAPGGKREHDRTFPLMFLYTNEFAWIPNTELTPITPGECGEAAEKQKSKTLAEAYKVAAEGHDLAHFKQMLLEHQEMLSAEVEAKAEREAKKAEKVSKQKRKSDVTAISDADKMDIDDAQPSKSQAKKRKKEAAADESEKPSKAPKTGTTKLKLNMTPKATTAETKKKATKAKSSTKKSATKASGSDEEETAKAQEEVLTPVQLREKKEKEVRYIRHKLQKGFLSRDTVPQDDEIETMSSYLGKVEAHPDLESGILRATKIHKVLKAMIRLDSIPKDDQYQFKKRSRDLLDKWNKILASDTMNAPDKEDESKADDVQQATGGESGPKDTTGAKADSDTLYKERASETAADVASDETKGAKKEATETAPEESVNQTNGSAKMEVDGADDLVEATKGAAEDVSTNA